MSASVCCAIISCSFVGMTETDTALSVVEMHRPLGALAHSSSFLPRDVSLQHNAAYDFDPSWSIGRDAIPYRRRNTISVEPSAGALMRIN